MTVRIFVIGCVATMVLASAIWALILLYLDPLQAGIVGYVLFFLSLFLVISSGMSLGGYALRRIVSRSQFPTYAVRVSLRQGIILGLFLNILLLLIRVRLYQWWVALILAILFIFVELIFLSYDRALKRRPNQTTADGTARA